MDCQHNFEFNDFVNTPFKLMKIHKLHEESDGGICLQSIKVD